MARIPLHQLKREAAECADLFASGLTYTDIGQRFGHGHKWALQRVGWWWDWNYTGSRKSRERGVRVPLRYSGKEGVAWVGKLRKDAATYDAMGLGRPPWLRPPPPPGGRKGKRHTHTTPPCRAR